LLLDPFHDSIPRGKFKIFKPGAPWTASLRRRGPRGVGVGGRWDTAGARAVRAMCRARGLGVNGELMGAFLHINTLLIVGGNVSVRSCTYRLSVTIEVHALPWDSERDGRYKQTKETFVVLIQ